MSAEKNLQITQHIAELEKSIYQIQAAIVEKTEMKSKLEATITAFQENVEKTRTEAETEFKESINQIQEVIDARKAEQRSLQNQMRDATSIKKKEWVKECIDNLQKSITHLEEGLKGRQNNLTEIETMFSLRNPDFVSRKETLTEVEKSIVHHKQELINKQNTLLRLKQHQ